MITVLSVHAYANVLARQVMRLHMHATLHVCTSIAMRW